MLYLKQSHSIYHLDIKTNNIFVQGFVIKLGDFGYATTRAWEFLTKGTEGFRAPEIEKNWSKAEN